MAERVTSPYGATTPKDREPDEPEPEDEPGGTQHFMYGPKFRFVREQAKHRDGYKCQSCGLTDEQHKKRSDMWGKGLHVHHKTPVEEFDNPEDAHTLDNLVTLCAACHRSEHW